jgi:hypothetical protein
MANIKSFESIKAALGAGRHWGKQDMTPPRERLPAKGDPSKRIEKVYSENRIEGERK